MSSAFSVRSSGISLSTRNPFRPGGEVYARCARAAEAVVMDYARRILERSQVYVPVDTEDLKTSGHLEPEGSGYNLRVSVVYYAYYAVYVHEILHYRHAPPTKAKYLEDAAREVRAEGPGDVLATGIDTRDMRTDRGITVR